MPWYLRVLLGPAVGSACGAAPPATKPKPRAELRWMEKERIAGITEGRGIPMTCDAKSTLQYAHAKPMFVITAADAEGVRVATCKFEYIGTVIVNYDVKFHLTKKAGDRLAAACAAPKGRMSAVSVGGKGWSGAVWPTVKVFTLQFHSSKAEAERFADTFE